MNWFTSNPVKRLYDTYGNLIQEKHLRQHGLEMQSWHQSQGDPIYAVGSYHFSGKLHPDMDLVDRAMSRLKSLRYNVRKNKEKNQLILLIQGMYKYYPHLSEER